MNKKITWLWMTCLIMLTPLSGQAVTLLSENFDDISTLPGNGWVLTNNSSPIGSTGWFQGNTAIFNAQAGLANAYIAANFDNATFGGSISNWLILPTLTLDSTSVLTFYTRTEPGAPAPDRLEIRLSTNGSSSNVGSTATSVGDFTTLLLSINPSLTTGAYPTGWTQLSIPLGGNILLPTNGRIAFRYFVSDTSVNGDYIGIDSVQVTNALVPEPSVIGLGVLGIMSVLGACRYGRRAN